VRASVRGRSDDIGLNPQPEDADIGLMPTPLKYPEPLSTAVLVRLTPELHDLVRQGAEEEGCGLAEFMRDATILRLAGMGLVPYVDHDPEQLDES
jgi:hypothetical protein